MSNFSIIIPEATTNLYTDPRFGAADPDTAWAIAGDGAQDVVRYTSDQWIGTGCAQFDIGGGTFVQLGLTVAVTNTSYTLSWMIKRAGGGAVTETQCEPLFDSSTPGNHPTWDSITQQEDNWYLCVYTGTATAGSRVFGIEIHEDAILADATQLENKAYRTTYTDGALIGHRDAPGATTTGYAWTGTVNASTSTRNEQERSGGRIYDLSDRGVQSIKNFIGSGMPGYDHQLSSYALLPGSLYQDTKVPERFFSLGLVFLGTSISNLHTNRQLLIDAVKIDLVTPRQPFRFYYVVATNTLEIDAFYTGGLEYTALSKFIEARAAFQMVAPDPDWRSHKFTGQVLTVNSDTTVINGGTSPGFPIITFTGSGGVDSLQNNTASADQTTIPFIGLSVHSGETVVLNLNTGVKTLNSDVLGNILSRVDPGGNVDLAIWALHEGSNLVKANTSDAVLGQENGDKLLFEDATDIELTENATIVADLEFKERHVAADGVTA